MTKSRLACSGFTWFESDSLCVFGESVVFIVNAHRYNTGVTANGGVVVESKFSTPANEATDENSRASTKIKNTNLLTRS